MTPEAFVAAVVAEVYASSVRDVLAELATAPAGRRPAPESAALARWYAEASPADRARVAQVARRSAHAAVFGFLAILDDVRSIDDPPHGHVELTHVTPDGVRTRLNPSAGHAMLHDLFQAHVWDEVFGAGGVPPATTASS